MANRPRQKADTMAAHTAYFETNAVPLASSDVFAIQITHDEFVKWASAKGMNATVVAFLAGRDDGAGATPKMWCNFAAVIDSGFYDRNSEAVAHQVTEGLIGSEALNAFADWQRTRTQPVVTH